MSDISRDIPPSKGQDREIVSDSLLDLMLRDALTSLDDIPEPTAEELAALDAMEGDDALGPLPSAPMPAPAPKPTPQMEEPKFLSLERLDLQTATDDEDEDLLGEDDFLDELVEEFDDVDADDEGASGGGYDLDDDDIEHYQDLYGEDGDIIPSFREGEIEEDDDEATGAFYHGLR